MKRVLQWFVAHRICYAWWRWGIWIDEFDGPEWPR